jgi:hypothetical protein
VDSLQRLVAVAPMLSDRSRVDWRQLPDELAGYGLVAESALAASWCVFETGDIAALVDPPTLALVFPDGVLCATRRGSPVRGRTRSAYIPFALCHRYEPVDHDAGAYGKFCIEFAGAGDKLLGRLRWTWRSRRFRSGGDEIRAAEIERDRILHTVSAVLG